jgi:Domain of unknown function (DUF4870)
VVLLLVVGVASLVLGIIAAVKASRGEAYRYLVNLRLVKWLRPGVCTDLAGRSRCIGSCSRMDCDVRTVELACGGLGVVP